MTVRLNETRFGPKKSRPDIFRPSPRILCLPMAYLGLAVAVGRQRALHKQNSGFSGPIWTGTFPRYVAIRFYFLSETLI